MRIDEKYLRVTMPDGSKWDVPIKVIAESRARYYAKADGVSYEESYEKDTISLFEEDAYNIEDWAANNMNWEDVKALAVRASDAEDDVDFQEGWINGEKEVVERPKK